MPLVENALASVADYGQQYRIDFSLTDRADDVWVYVDGMRLQQVFGNLLSNAKKIFTG